LRQENVYPCKAYEETCIPAMLMTIRVLAFLHLLATIHDVVRLFTKSHWRHITIPAASSREWGQLTACPMSRIIQVSLALAGLVLSTPVVANASGMQREIVELHPTAENIPEVTDPRFILNEDPTVTFMGEASHEKITIGVADGEYHEMFGRVASLALTGNGTLLVVDAANVEVRLYDYDGTLLTTFGGSGEGPGEFRDEPDNISVVDNGSSVFVLGSFGDFVTAFELEGESTVTPKGNFYTGLSAHNGCAMNGHFWVYGYDPGFEGVLHKFTYGGERVASFLEYYKSPRQYFSQRFSRNGLIACSEAHGIVALNRLNSPVVTGYREDGEMAWQVKLADFDPVRMAEYSPRGWGWHRPEPGQSMLRSIFTDPAGDFYVHYLTYEKKGFDNTPDHGPLFKIDARTGEGTYLGIAPSVVRGIDSGYVFSTTNDPFPQVVVHKPKRD